MPRFYIEKNQILGEKAIVTGDAVNHIKNVLRMRTGDGVILCDGEGMVYDATISQINSSEITCFITKAGLSDTELSGNLVLFQGLPKKDKMEWIIQKSVELGVSEVVPVQMARTIVKLEDAKKEAKKLERWRNIAKSAAEQSGRGKIPEVSGVLTFSEALAKAETLAYNLIPYEKAEHMAESQAAIKEAARKKSVGIFIGPEGGITEEEWKLALQKGVKSISLGKRILRTETAGLTALSLLMFEMETIREEREKSDKKTKESERKESEKE